MRTKMICCLFSLMTMFTFSTLAAQRHAAAGDVGASLYHSALVTRFYKQNNDRIFWLVKDELHCYLRMELLRCIDSAVRVGLVPQKYHRDIIQKYISDIPYNIPVLLAADDLFTDAALTLCKDIYTGEHMNKWLSYDGISSRYEAADNDFLVKGLAAVTDSCDLQHFITHLEPQTRGYTLLKAELNDCRKDGNSLRIKQLTTSMNYYRWIWHFPLDSFIVVNIGSATLKFYIKDSVLLSMRTVMGAPDKRTPRFAAYCKEVTLYPYWNMPHSIAVNEWLPSIKRNPHQLSLFSMDLIDKNGRIVDPATIKWSTLSSSYFPYRIRQQTGCLNPMGVVKFTLTSPYDVYMHDTNFPGAFLSQNRYYSHGCIRIQDPISLANALLVNKVDTAYLKACYKGQLPVVLPVLKPVPVFVVYMTAEADEEGIHYFKDSYQLLK